MNLCMYSVSFTESSSKFLGFTVGKTWQEHIRGDRCLQRTDGVFHLEPDKTAHHMDCVGRGLENAEVRAQFSGFHSVVLWVTALLRG